MDSMAKTTIQYASWPIVVLIALIIFYSPIQSLIAKVDTIKAGSIEARFVNGLNQQGLSEEQLKVVRSLTPAEMDLFLLTSYSDSSNFNYTTDIDTSSFRKTLFRLQDAGLLVITNPTNDGTNLRHKTTLVGKHVRYLLISNAVDMLRAR